MTTAYLKRGKPEAARAEDDAKVRATVEAILAHCRTQLTGYKKPKHVIFVEELPKNPSGKVLKRDLRPQLTASLSIDHRTEEPRHG